MCLVALLARPSSSRAQSPAFLDVGSQQERYDRVLQIAGYASLYPWSVRGLSPAELTQLAVADTGNPWSLRVDQPIRQGRHGRLHWALLPVEATAYFNSAFPYGFNDGAVWQGRGLTGALKTGMASRWGRLTLQLEPVVFDAQNAGFTLKPNGQIGQRVYADGFHPGNIDLPQRFGPHAYARLDPGQSTLRLELPVVALGFSTANEFWGPALESPLILGDNAAGFPHVFIGSAKAINIWIGRVRGRVIYGRLEESAYAAPDSLGSSRFGTGLAGVFVPRGLTGLELGAARFFHMPWPSGGLSASDLLHPFEGFLKQGFATASNPTGNDPHDNQLASFFFRWVFPRSGFEVYGEYGREDHNVNARDFWEEIDHYAAYTIGMQRVWRPSSARWYVLHAELSNSRIGHLQQGREESNWYSHFAIVQGHTNMGQVLGAPGGAGGGASTLQLDRYDPTGRWSIVLNRTMRAQRVGAGGLPVAGSADVLESLGLERLVRTTPADLTVGLTQVWDVNRDFTGTRANFNLQVGARVPW